MWPQSDPALTQIVFKLIPNWTETKLTHRYHCVSIGYMRWISMDIHAFPWIPIGIHRYWSPGISWNINWCPGIFMDINRHPWISMDVNGYPWISMDVRGYPWMSLSLVWRFFGLLYVDVSDLSAIREDHHGWDLRQSHLTFTHFPTGIQVSPPGA